MPKTKDISLKQVVAEQDIDIKKGEVIKETKTYRSQLEASKNYDKNNVDNIRLRLPKGYNEIMKKFVQEHEEYSSVNDFIRKAIETQLEGYL